jgi:hypothetical protein
MTVTISAQAGISGDSDTSTTEGDLSSKVIESAAGAAKASKRRGPNSHRVKSLFDALTTEPQPLNDLINKYHVSAHVARQSKRFDTSPEKGQVVIKTLPDPNPNCSKRHVCIWRMPQSSMAAVTPAA